MKAKKDSKKKQTYYGIFFLGFIIFLYIILFLFDSGGIQRSFKASGNVLMKIVPILLFVIFFMGMINYYVNPKTISNYLGRRAGIKGWFVAIATGVLSHGPVYAWYPLLKDLQNQEMKSSLIAVFLYSRAIKIPLLPLVIYYFGILFVVILTCYVIIASIVEGKIIELIERKGKRLQGQ